MGYWKNPLTWSTIYLDYPLMQAPSHGRIWLGIAFRQSIFSRAALSRLADSRRSAAYFCRSSYAGF
jgi:hypothetical protein